MKNLTVLDLEVYPNYTLFAFKHLETGVLETIELIGENSELTDEERGQMVNIMKNRITFGFNSRNYDLPLIILALQGKSAEEIYEIGDKIITENIPYFHLYKMFHVKQPKSFDHFDVQEPAPGVRVSLKLYAGRMNFKQLQDLPIEPGTTVSEEQMQSLRSYCENDLDITIALYDRIKDRIDLRVEMGKQYGEDLRSRSDAQIAESVIRSAFVKLTGKRPYAPKIPTTTTFKYEVPDFIEFQTPGLQEMLEKIRKHDFALNDKGGVINPPLMKDTKIQVGYSTYQFGIGGIHSCEKKQCIIPDPDKRELLIDKDVASYYPSIILNLELYPRHLGEHFLSFYRSIVQERLAAKAEGNKVVNESLKIVINGGFGKLCSKFSALYAPDLFIGVTLTGQLSLLMLIEALENEGIYVVSANTDGFVSLLRETQHFTYESICAAWEKKTCFNLDETYYNALYSRDVNNYLAITRDGKMKGKGIFTVDPLSKNPQAPICVAAVAELLKSGKAISDTIMECTDVSQFLNVRSVTGGAVWQDAYLGKVVRWIYTTEDNGPIRYKTNGNKVPKSDSSEPLMRLPEKVPSSIDRERYIDEAMFILDDLGLTNL